ncbi:MAG TPA: sigma-54 dependent transcriptional regulator [Candidatus Hydrogenedentes bacterium]|nr:sigma-54 dependent transcriptional regulator [Candidatus Hydrogenedentota bacterium]HPG67886.1 sigma-54 dependent transcriptional regulator [Candidatus Hydrogenedentota bacterium]
MPKYRILVIDDEALMREYVEETLVRAGYEVDSVASGASGVEVFRQKGHDVIVTDLKMAPMDGLEVLRQVRAESSDAHCIVMTAYGTIETAVAALKGGADDYILKPFAPDELELAVERAIERGRLAQENRYLRAELNALYDFQRMVGDSPAMRAVYDSITKVADSRATVLIRGESGTGKELVARAIHFTGNRRDKPFIKVNCAALSAGLLESELFGHEKGSFTGAHERKIGRFELADGGTLLLDEVSEITPELQPKLLRALQEREFDRVGGSEPIRVDTRIVATSNRDLERAIEEGKFREDLFFRLSVIPIHLPPLRDRRQDIPALMDHFLARYAQENGRSITGFTDSARKAFIECDWPGNVRELQNAIERAVVLSTEPLLGPQHFALGSTRVAAPVGRVAFPKGLTVAEMEKELILQTLDACGQNRTRAAEVLGISVRTLRNKLSEYRGGAPADAQ